jgi:hypothetical protein
VETAGRSKSSIERVEVAAALEEPSLGVVAGWAGCIQLGINPPYKSLLSELSDEGKTALQDWQVLEPFGLDAWQVGHSILLVPYYKYYVN